MIEKMKQYWLKAMGTNPALKIAGLICIVLFVFVIAPILASQLGINLFASRQSEQPRSAVPAAEKVEETVIEDVILDPEEPGLPAPPSPTAPNAAAPAPTGSPAPPVAPPNTELTAQERAALERERAAR